MTICIAAICDKGKSVVVASDRMITADYLALEFEHPGPKYEKLAEKCVGLTAGDALSHVELFRKCKQYIYQLKSPSIEVISKEVKDQFVALRKKRAEELYLSPRGLTIGQFYLEGFMTRLPNDLALVLDRNIQASNYNLYILIVGVDSTGAHIYNISDPGIINCFDKLGYNAIGSGDRHALYSIIGNNHNTSLDLNQTAYLVYKAKRRAELAPGVGDAVEMAFIDDKGIHRLNKNQISKLSQILVQEISPTKKEILDQVLKLSIRPEREE